MIENPAASILPAPVEEFDPSYHRLPFPNVDAQPKLDGWRCMARWEGDSVALCSRSGEPIVLPHISTALADLMPRGAVWDGEVYADGLSVTMIGSGIKHQSTRLAYHVFDAPVVGGCADLPWRMRRHHLLEALANSYGPVYRVVAVPLVSEERADCFFRGALSLRYEGMIYRTHDGRYGETGSVLKRKPYEDAEFEIIDADPSFTGKRSIVLKTPDGRAFSLSGPAKHLRGSRADLIGQLATVTFCGRTEHGLPREPRFKAIRNPSDLPAGAP